MIGLNDFQILTSVQVQMEAVYTTALTWKEAIDAPALRDLLWVSMVETVKVSLLAQGLIRNLNIFLLNGF